jgi:hypothetical protein
MRKLGGNGSAQFVRWQELRIECGETQWAAGDQVEDRGKPRSENGEDATVDGHGVSW